MTNDQRSMVKVKMKKTKLKTCHQPSAINHQNGFAFIAIILIVIVVFSIALVSGATPTLYPERKPAADSSSSGSDTQPTATPASSSATLNTVDSQDTTITPASNQPLQ